MTGRDGTAAPGDGDGAGDGAGRGRPRTDGELLRAHADGDPRAFEEVVVRHSARLYAVALRTLGDREEALDAVQDALLSAHRAAGTFRGDARVSTWLHRITVNACLDRARRRAVRPVVHLPDLPGGAEALEAVPDPRDHEAERDTSREVEAALARLPVEQRAALVLVDLHGHRVEEAARILGCPEGTVKSRCARGRARLAVLLGHLAPPPGNGGGAEPVRPAGPPSPPPGRFAEEVRGGRP